MSKLIEKIEGQKRAEALVPFRVGDTVKVNQKIREGDKERIQVFQGVVIARQGGGAGVQALRPPLSLLLRKRESTGMLSAA